MPKLPLRVPNPFRLETLTWPEAEAALDGAVAILPAGAMEAHGPHLPLHTDVLIAQGMAEEGARLLARKQVKCAILPALAYSPAEFAADFPGTVSLSEEAQVRTVEGIAASLARAGAKALAIANSHFDPANRSALKAAAEAAGKHLPTAYPDLARRANAERLTGEFRSGACHAGQFETSIVLALAPKLVRRDLMKGLPANPVSLSEAIGQGKRTFRECGGPRAYFGFPAKATAREGRKTLGVLGGILAESVLSSC